MTPSRRLLALPVIVLLCLGGCKKKLPEHEIQKREQEALRKKRRSLIKKGKLKAPTDKTPPGHAGHGHGHGHGGHDHDDHGHDEKGKKGGPKEPAVKPFNPATTKWPKPLKRALFRLLEASPKHVPTLCQQVANYGPMGYDALRAVITQTRQPKAKRALASFLLAEGHMFQPEELAKMGREALLPYLQRAAIDALARLKDKHSQLILARLAE